MHKKDDFKYYRWGIGIAFIISGINNICNFNYLLAVICFVIGSLILYHAYRLYQIQKLYNKYKPVLYYIDDLSIQNIAYRMGIDPNQVRRDIKFLIKKNCFGNAFIDAYDDKLVLANMNSSQNKKRIKVICPGCNQEVYIPKGEKRICEYCGNVLFAPK